jgi:hypothetical protein
MDNSSAWDKASIFSGPSKDSRPSTPSQVPLNPLVPPYYTRSESPLRTATPLGRTDDYFSQAPTRGTRGNTGMPAGYTPPEDGYELSSLSQRSYDPHETTDSTSLLAHNREESRSPPPNRGAYV